MWEERRLQPQRLAVAPKVWHVRSQSQTTDDKIEPEQCRSMARVCDWKAGTEADPNKRKRWLNLARRWRDLATKIEAGAW
jgi:hypothetical protein